MPTPQPTQYVGYYNASNSTAASNTYYVGTANSLVGGTVTAITYSNATTPIVHAGWHGYSATTFSSSTNGGTYGNQWYPPRSYNNDEHRRVMAQYEAARQRVLHEEEPAYQARRELVRRQVQDANRRARELLLSCLTAEQRASFERTERFRVVSSKGNIFEIRNHRVHNVFRLDLQGEPLEEWCVTVQGNVPICDVLLAQKVYLEADEDLLAERANVTLLRARERGLIRRSDVQYSHHHADFMALPMEHLRAQQMAG